LGEACVTWTVVSLPAGPPSFEFRSSEGMPERFPALLADLVRLRVRRSVYV